MISRRQEVLKLDIVFIRPSRRYIPRMGKNAKRGEALLLKIVFTTNIYGFLSSSVSKRTVLAVAKVFLVN